MAGKVLSYLLREMWCHTDKVQGKTEVSRHIVICQQKERRRKRGVKNKEAGS